MNDFNQKVNDFTTLILETPEFAELKAATEELKKDPKATKLIDDVQAKKETVMTLQQTGLPVSKNQELDLQDAFANMRSNPTCMRLIKAQNAAIQIARKVCNRLTVATGIPFSRGGGCCG
ncbi:MAG: YlbF family regulator [Patescibacteria group bacterium]|nr:YlbF family regulator [Patescibacteria group bacterium]MCL5432242.1 YlbF family regulator [Patescibacteria group bacterium]